MAEVGGVLLETIAWGNGRTKAGLEPDRSDPDPNTGPLSGSVIALEVGLLANATATGFAGFATDVDRTGCE